MNDNYEDLISNVMDSFDMSYNPLHRNNTSYQNNNQYVPNNINMRFVNRQLDTFNLIIRGYNENHIEYQRNIGQILTMLYINNTNYRNRLIQPLPVSNQRTNQNRGRPTTRPHVTPIASRTRRPTQLFSRTTPLTSSLFEFRTTPSLFQEPPPNPNQQPLTMEQIVNATTTFEYNDNTRASLSDYRCPISLENFQNGDTLCRINGCGHVFNKRVLLNWLQRSSQCPVCRHNLSQNNETNESQTNIPQQDSSNNNFTLFTRSFTQNPSISMDNLEGDLLTSMTQFITEAQDSLLDLSNNLFDLSLNDVYDNDSSDIEDNLSVDE